MSDLNFISDLMHELQPIAVKMISGDFSINHKNDGSPVTNIDKNIELYIRDKIINKFPDDGIVGEEFPPHNQLASRQWIIDPIDGTKALLAGFPTFTTLIALLESGKPVCSGILQPITGELWLSDGKETNYQGRTVNCIAKTKIEDAVFSTTSPLLFRDADITIINNIMNKTSSNQFGGDAYAYGKLSCGNIHLIIESGMKAFDFLPLVPVITGSGGIITDWQGNTLNIKSNGDVIAASSESLHKQALSLLNAA